MKIFAVICTFLTFIKQLLQLKECVFYFVLIRIECEVMQGEVDKLRGTNICRRVQRMTMAVEGGMGGMTDCRIVLKLGHFLWNGLNRCGETYDWLYIVLKSHSQRENGQESLLPDVYW